MRILFSFIAAGTFFTTELVQPAAAASTFFATPVEARTALTTHDDFVTALSPFDRAARLKTRRVISEQAFLAYVGTSVLPWTTAAEKKRVQDAITHIQARFKELDIRFPEIHFIKTNGKEEGGAAYTRGNVIVLPAGRRAGRRRTGLREIDQSRTFPCHVARRCVTSPRFIQDDRV